VHGDIRGPQPPLVRVHVQDTLGDVIGVQSPRLGWPLRSAMRRIAAEGAGVVVLLRYPETPRQLAAAVRGLAGTSQAEPARRERVAVLRTFGTGAQILRDLGVTRMRVLSAPKQMHGISGFGLEVVEYVDDPS
jgi:3,4-dihydroxy 2-butanone 4-phosphate synthase/GTP cyclohydrolase II